MKNGKSEAETTKSGSVTNQVKGVAATPKEPKPESEVAKEKKKTRRSARNKKSSKTDDAGSVAPKEAPSTSPAAAAAAKGPPKNVQVESGSKPRNQNTAPKLQTPTKPHPGNLDVVGKEPEKNVVVNGLSSQESGGRRTGTRQDDRGPQGRQHNRNQVSTL
jgi:hypothetical protein